jgi:hypothetical protein
VAAAVGEFEFSEPATRSLTVFDTRTSPERAVAATRAVVCTATPPTLLPVNLTSPVCARCANVDAELTHPIPHAQATPDRACRTIERGEKSIASGIDFAPPVPISRWGQDGHITMPDLPGIGFEGKSDLYAEMKALSA